MTQPLRFASRITVLIPAHNEQESLPATLESMLPHGFGDIIVIADNCTDGTVDVAQGYGATVFETEGNEHKKAGALNYALHRVLPVKRSEDYVLIVDADTTLSETFLSAAQEAFRSSPDIGAVGGVFRGDNPRSVIEIAQANEYARFAREVERTRRTMVLSGTSSLIRVSALEDVMMARGGYLPGRRGDIYKRDALTEDGELSIALKTLGYTLASPEACSVTTELMPTPATLHRQRVRWYRGACETLASYGLTRVTARYWFQQVMLAWGSLMMALMLTIVSIGAWVYGLTASPLWLTVTAIFVIERTLTVWRRAGWRGRLMAMAIIPEMVYVIALQVAFLHGLTLALARKQHQWHHLTIKETAHV